MNRKQDIIEPLNNKLIKQTKKVNGMMSQDKNGGIKTNKIEIKAKYRLNLL